jgi:putative membrane protein
MIAIVSILLLSLGALAVTAWLVPAIEVTSWPMALLVALLVSLINTFARPLTKLVGAHFNPVALIIFMILLNLILFFLAAYFGFGILVDVVPALVVAVIYSVVMILLSFVMYKK